MYTFVNIYESSGMIATSGIPITFESARIINSGLRVTCASRKIVGRMWPIWAGDEFYRLAENGFYMQDID